VKQYPVTNLLLVSVLALFGVELALGALGNDALLLGLGAMPDSGTIGGQYWRLLTYAWLHASYLHITMNVVLLWWVGRIVERRTGSLATLGVYLAGVLAGGMMIAWRAATHPKPGVSLGASAAVAGLLACGLVLLYRPRAAHFGQALWVRATLWVVVVGGLAISFLPGVSLVGHLGGLVLGAVLGSVVPVRDAQGETALEGGGSPP
jgi:rhomboid protease GluP